MKTGVICFVLFLHVSTATAQVGFGRSDCGEWINKPSAQKKTWLMGYLSGMNFMWVPQNKTSADPLDKLNSAEQMYVWMDNYCKSNPLKTVSDGAVTLFFELVRKP